MGAEADPEERAARREWDAFDPYFDHLILVDLDPASPIRSTGWSGSTG